MGACISGNKTNKGGKTPIPYSTKVKQQQGGIQSKYKLLKMLGTGNFGKVALGQNRANKQHYVAIKSISKNKIKQSMELIKEEIKILQTLDHPNIVKYYETFESENYMYLVMEYCSGYELFEKISAKKDDVFTQREATFIMEKLFRAINHCHANQVAHRDLKPENILYSSKQETAQLKIIDFGLSKQTKKSNSNSMATIVGTPYYVAPQVLAGKYGFDCDQWSIGVILYILLSGYLPFSGDNAAEVFEKIQEGRFDFHHREWRKVSDEAKDLIKRLLTVDPKKRIKPGEALKHEWFRTRGEGGISSQDRKLDPDVIKSLRQYQGSSKLRKQAMNVLVKMMNENDLQHLRAQFHKIDQDNTGFINADQLEKAVRESGQDWQADEIKEIIKKVDYYGNGKINYSEFLAATVSAKNFLTDQKLHALFKHFDIDNTNVISIENIQEAMHKAGKQISKDELKEIMKKHDLQQNNVLDFRQFKIMMLGEGVNMEDMDRAGSLRLDSLNDAKLMKL